MPVLSIIGCRILEDELAHVLCSDCQLQRLILMDNPECSGLAAKLQRFHRPHLILGQEALDQQLAEARGKRPGSFLSRLLTGMGGSKENDYCESITVVVNILKMALHADSRMLRQAVCQNINLMSRFSDGILLFYGQCGKSLANLEEDLEDLPCHLFFLEDDSCQMVDDCIAAALGGNEQYGKTLESHPGIGIYFTPMWACNWREMDMEARRSGKSAGLGKMLKDLGYGKIARLDTGLSFTSSYETEERIEELAKDSRLEVVCLQGGTEVSDRCYALAKKRLLKARNNRILQPSASGIR